jgi:hypothetical protein
MEFQIDAQLKSSINIMSSEVNSAFFKWLNLVYKWFQFLKENNPYNNSVILEKKSDYKF